MKACSLALIVAFGIAGCGAPPRAPTPIHPAIVEEMNRAVAAPAPAAPDARVQEALLPPLRLEAPGAAGRPAEPRFDLAVNGAPAAQVFMSIVSGTRYSMLVHPEVAGTVSVNLKDVTVPEALDALRDLYGYDYRIDGTRIFVHPLTIQTRVFRVNYLIGQRTGRSDVRVTSGSVADAPAGVAAAGTGAPASGASSVADASRIQTSTRNDFWEDLRQTLQQIVGAEAGRNVVINPQAGVVVVRAMPDQLRQVDAYLRAIRASVERQVMLEAKIVEVTLSEQYQSGVNWALFSSSGRSGGGMINPNTRIGTGPAPNTSGNLGITLAPGAAAVTAGALGSLIPGVPAGGLFGLAFQTQNFAALLQFLESQGSVQVLSSPRIATLNNQKAVLKVGTDEFFITNVAGGSTITAGAPLGGTTSFPTLTLRPFFSGVALDVTPQIDDDSSIILHIHPSVSNVQQDDRNVNLGAVFGGQITLPLARSAVSETDSVVRATDGNIVAIGGLMKVDVGNNNSGLPGAKDSPTVGGLFGSTRRTSVKKELVILIKPTVIHSERDWAGGTRDARDRILEMGGPKPGAAAR